MPDWVYKIPKRAQPFRDPIPVGSYFPRPSDTDFSQRFIEYLDARKKEYKVGAPLTQDYVQRPSLFEEIKKPAILSRPLSFKCDAPKKVFGFTQTLSNFKQYASKIY